MTIKNADLPAMPITNSDLACELQIGAKGAGGLTKREHFAAMAMQGLCSHSGDYHCAEDMANDAVVYADALLKQLEKTGE